MAIIETWRWRLVICGIGLGLVWTGGYGMLHPNEVPLNICYSPESELLQVLNAVASVVTFVAVTAAGAGLVYWAGYSAKKGLAIREDRKPIDYRDVGKTVLAYAAILAALALLLMLAHCMLKDATLD